MPWEPLGSANRLPRLQAPPWPSATFCVNLLHFVLDSCMTNYHQRGGLEQGNLFSPCSRGRKAKVRVSAELCCSWELVGENPSSSLSALVAFFGLWLHHSNLYIGILQRNKTCRMCVYTHTQRYTHTYVKEGGGDLLQEIAYVIVGAGKVHDLQVWPGDPRKSWYSSCKGLCRMHSSLGETFIFFVKTSPDWVRPTHTMMGHQLPSESTDLNIKSHLKNTFTVTSGGNWPSIWETQPASWHLTFTVLLSFHLLVSFSLWMCLLLFRH